MATPIPTNKAAFTLEETLSATGGTLVLAGDGAPTTEVSTDTRKLGAGAIFVALAGEKFDGHAHVSTAMERGAKLLVIERDIAKESVDLAKQKGVAIVRVRSTYEALGGFGRAYARRWRAKGGVRKTIAITGSAGKTTTRVATAALLERLHPGEVLGGEGNLNNLVGVPMVLLTLADSHRYAVLEMGTNRPGEIEALAKAAEPDVGLVTLVSTAHVEELGSIEGVAREKGALFRGLSEGGVAIGNGDNDFVRGQIERSPARTKVLYGTRDDAQVKIKDRAVAGMYKSRIVLERKGRGDIELVTQLLGEAGAYACAAAICAVETGLGERITQEIASDALSEIAMGHAGGRLAPTIVPRDIAVIDDSYNANPASMRASIRAASEIASSVGRRLVLVLGEMRELGSAAESGHDEVGVAARESGAAVVIAVGTLAKRIAGEVAKGNAKVVHVGTAEEAAALMKIDDPERSWVMPNDLVLVKGSRAIGTERVLRALNEVSNPGAETSPRAESAP